MEQYRLVLVFSEPNAGRPSNASDGSLSRTIERFSESGSPGPSLLIAPVFLFHGMKKEEQSEAARIERLAGANRAEGVLPGGRARLHPLSQAHPGGATRGKQPESGTFQAA